jgi:alkylmercury lyase
MTTPSLDELRTTWTIRPGFSTRWEVIDLLADGKPATPEALTAATGLSIEEVTAHIDDVRRRGGEVEDGAIVGAALTLRPTEHRFRLRGHDLYTWCGFDALFLPVLLGEPAEVASTCPVTGTGIRLVVGADGTVSHSSPKTVVVGIVGQDVTSCCPFSGPGSAVCTQMPFLSSREAGERWLLDHPGVAVIDLDDAREIARTYVDSLT